MKETIAIEAVLLPVSINATQVQWGIAGGGEQAYEKLRLILKYGQKINVTVMAELIDERIKRLADAHHHLTLLEKEFNPSDLGAIGLLVVATENKILDEKIHSQARQRNVMVYVPSDLSISDFVLNKTVLQGPPHSENLTVKKNWWQKNSEQSWKNLTSKLILVFLLVVVGHFLISYLPFPSF